MNKAIMHATKLQLVLLLHLFLIQIVYCEGRQKRRKPHEIRPGRHEDVDRFDEIYKIVRNSFAIALTPVILSFLYAVYNDPQMPLVRRALYNAMRKRLLGKLSRRDKGVKKSPAHSME